MSNIYYPDSWEIIRIESPEFAKIDKVLASFYGGHMGGDAWKLSSGITSFTHVGDIYEFLNESGSIYNCHASAIGASSMAREMLERWRKAIEDTKSDITITIITQDYIKGNA